MCHNNHGMQDMTVFTKVVSYHLLPYIVRGGPLLRDCPLVPGNGGLKPNIH